jgi:pimeloyl-ACP methyl ester carboxylesterase
LIVRLPRSDRQILADPLLRAVLVRDMQEAVRQGPGGILRDLQLEGSPWDLPFTRVTCPVSLWHGTRDNVVPLAAVDALAALLPDAQVRKLPGAGHFFVFAAWEEILAWLLGRG